MTLSEIEYNDNKSYKVINQDKSIYKKFIEAQSKYSNYNNLNFKIHVMRILSKLDVYFKPHIAINGRLAYQGYAPNPHVGGLFRFAKIKKETLDVNGLNHIKIALSHSLENKFDSNEAHIK